MIVKALITAALLAAPMAAHAQDHSTHAAPAAAPAKPGLPDAARVTGGAYEVDSHHTQVVWSVDHLGISTLYGMFGEMTGTLALDPKTPQNAKLSIAIPLTGLTVTSAAFAKHLSSPDFFDVAKYPTASFVSTGVKVMGTKAEITGDLTLHGVTKPVTLQAAFHGAGANPMNKVENIGFSATTSIKRSDFGLGMAVPMVSDEVKLKIVAAFVKK
ncbi:YceI family protein [Phenylobacterium immobile]|uniref:YceI family protein n=1 Tax=Phenylobacterium immobile TaxID=21 RepID=UPI000B304009|nr:YceI family protein [Phenylobacterium immobile]